MPDVALWHRLYTHADSTGARFVEVEHDASRVLPPEAAKHLDELLRKTRGGFVVRRYSGGFVCVITSETVDDAGGRRGVRNHARLRKSEEMFAVAQLMEVAEPHALEDVPRAQLRDLVAAWLATQGRKAAVRVRIDGLDGRTAAIGWAAMPLALQHGASWGVDTDDGCPVDVVLSASGGRRVSEVATPQLLAVAGRYVERLLDGPREFRAILSNPAISSAARLAAAVEEGWR
jgi:hypothetical protein